MLYYIARALLFSCYNSYNKILPMQLVNKYIHTIRSKYLE